MRDRLLGDLDNVLYEIANEGDASSKAWQYYLIQVIRDYEAGAPLEELVRRPPLPPGKTPMDMRVERS